MIRRPPRSTRTEHSFPTRRSSDLGDFFEPLEQVGATDSNGTTNMDRTNYFETVPTGALDRELFLRSEEHTSELQSLMRISYAVFCLKKKQIKYTHNCASCRMYYN